MLAAITIALLAQSHGSHGSAAADMGPSVGGRTSVPDFAFAVGNTGLSEACACTDVTGTKGEAVTWLRNTTASCFKGSWQSGIAPGDMVMCAASGPLVAHRRDGTGPLGVQVYTAITNQVLWSHPTDFTKAEWNKEWDNAGRTPVLWHEDAGSLETGVLTDAWHFPATTGGQYSNTYQGFMDATCPCTASVAVTAAPVPLEDGGVLRTATTLDLCSWGDPSGWTCSECEVPGDGGYAFCEHHVASGMAGAIKLGNNSSQNGGVARAAADVLVDCPQLEAWPYRQPCVPTTSAAVQRLADQPTVTGTWPVYPMSMAVSVDAVSLGGLVNKMPLYVGPAASQVAAYAHLMWWTGNPDAMGNAAGTLQMATVTDPRISADAGMHPGAPFRFAGWVANSTVVGCLNGVCGGAVTFAGVPPHDAGTTIALGHWVNGMDYIDGWIGNVCIDSSPGRCR